MKLETDGGGFLEGDLASRLLGFLDHAPVGGLGFGDEASALLLRFLLLDQLDSLHRLRLHLQDDADQLVGFVFLVLSDQVHEFLGELVEERGVVDLLVDVQQLLDLGDDGFPAGQRIATDEEIGVGISESDAGFRYRHDLVAGTLQGRPDAEGEIKVLANDVFGALVELVEDVAQVAHGIASGDYLGISQPASGV